MSRAERPDLRPWLVRACIALPVLMLAANVLAWLRWGTDLPFLDDWRAYDERNALSFSPARLLEPINNTVSPIGLALDALAQHWLGGSPLAYQALSMLLVLGGLLWLQAMLLKWAVGLTFLAALLFALTLFMLQGDTYWGQQNLAYHQALPLLALLGAMSLTLIGAGTRHVRFIAVLVLGLVAGLSYVSGAIAAMVMGGSLWCTVAALNGKAGRDLLAKARSGAMALLLSGLVTSLLQVVLTRWGARRPQIMSLTMPDSPEFWTYLFGKIGRSSGKGFDALGFEIAWVVIIVALLVLTPICLAVVVHTRRVHLPAAIARLSLVFFPLWMAVASYLVLVSLGRAGYRDPSVEGLVAVFRFAYERFHFFWVTLLYPWVAGVGFLLLRDTVGRWAGRRVPMALLACGLSLVGIAVMARGVFDIPSSYRSTSAYRSTEIRCLSTHLGTDLPFTCPGYELMGLTDLTRAYEYASSIDASFVRYFPIVARDRLGSEWVRWDRGRDGAFVAWSGAVTLADGWFLGQGDPRALISLPESEPAPERCLIMGVRLGLDVKEAGRAQVFFRPAGASEFDEANSSVRLYQPDSAGNVSLEFVLESPTGFSPQLRIDPADGTAQWRLTHLNVACRLRSLR